MINTIASLNIFSIIILCSIISIICLILIFNKNIKKRKSDNSMLWITVGGMIVVVFYKIIQTYFLSNALLLKISGCMLLGYIIFFILAIFVCSIIEYKSGNISNEKKKHYILVSLYP